MDKSYTKTEQGTTPYHQGNGAATNGESAPLHEGNGQLEPKIPCVNEAFDDPHRLARMFLHEQCQHVDRTTLITWRDETHLWDGSAYRLVPTKELRAHLTSVVKDEMNRVNALAVAAALAKGEDPPTARKVTSKLIGDVAHALASMTILQSKIEPPTWLDGTSPCPASEILAARNRLVDLRTLKIHPHTPLFFNQTALDYDFDPNAPEPTQWLKFLDELWEDQQDCIDTLQEEFGYCLGNDTSQQKIFLHLGPKRSGKGTIARVKTRMIGVANVAGPTLASLGTNFGLWPLLGKSLAIISDARLSGRTDAALVTERLLSISGEDVQTVDRKNLSHVTTKLNVRFVIISNEMPRLSDPSGALVSRMIVLPFTKSWYGREDTRLTLRLLTEIPGILNWALEGRRRLIERGYFIQPLQGQTIIEEMEALSSPIGAFIKDCCMLGPDREVEVKELFNRWQEWCTGKGKKDAGTEQLFGRDLRAAVPTLGMRQPRLAGGRLRIYTGISIRGPLDEEKESFGTHGTRSNPVPTHRGNENKE
jgi:putative DNA primase/helicase